MANYKSFVFNSTNDDPPLVTPTGSRYHLYIDSEGQIRVIDSKGNIVPQNGSVTSASSNSFDTIQMIPQNVLPPAQMGLIFFSANTGLMICNGDTATGWTNFYTQHSETFP